MPRTAREHRLSCIGTVIIIAVGGLLYLIFGENTFQNPFIVIIFLIFTFFTFCWLFGWIHPTTWAKRRKQKKEYSYIKEVPGISTSVPIQEEKPNVNKIICPYCGVLQDQETKFCTKCGQKIE